MRECLRSYLARHSLSLQNKARNGSKSQSFSFAKECNILPVIVNALKLEPIAGDIPTGDIAASQHILHHRILPHPVYVGSMVVAIRTCSTCCLIWIRSNFLLPVPGSGRTSQIRPAS